MTSLAMPRAWHLLALLATLAGIAANPASAVTETYLFRDSFAPSEGAGNELVPVYNGTGTILTGGQGFVDGSFVTETISAAACSSTPTVRAWSFPQFGGLRYDNAMPVVATGSYSISMLLRFSPVSPGYARLVDFSGSTLDSGIYELDGAVSFYPLGTYLTGSFVSDQDVFVTITREATSGLVALYIDGAPLPSFSDGRTSYYVPTDKVIYFLMDNTTGPANIRESEPGTIAYLQVRDTPMTAAEVAASLADICGAVAATTTTTSTTTTTLSPCGNGTIDPGETCDDGPANGTPTSCCSSGCTVSAVGPTCVALVTAPSLIRSRHAPAAIPLTVTLPAAPGKGAARGAQRACRLGSSHQGRAPHVSRAAAHAPREARAQPARHPAPQAQRLARRHGAATAHRQAPRRRGRRADPRHPGDDGAADALERPASVPEAASQPAPPDRASASPRDFTTLVRIGCEDYVLHGIGLPLAAYAFHAVKLALFVLGWMFFVRFTPGLGSPWHLGAWWRADAAFQKAVLWACLVEVLGCGCMSG